MRFQFVPQRFPLHPIHLTKSKKLTFHPVIPLERRLLQRKRLASTPAMVRNGPDLTAFLEVRGDATQQVNQCHQARIDSVPNGSPSCPIFAQRGIQPQADGRSKLSSSPIQTGTSHAFEGVPAGKLPDKIRCQCPKCLYACKRSSFQSNVVSQMMFFRLLLLPSMQISCEW